MRELNWSTTCGSL